MVAVDPWTDGWETIADQGAAEVKPEAIDAVGGTGSSSGSSTTSNSSSLATVPPVTKSLVQKSPKEEENRKIWEAANATNAYEVITSSTAPNKTVAFKPELKILKRTPASTPTPQTVSTNSEAPTILDRKEKERRYAEARERLFGPASSPAMSDSTTPVTNTPTTAMSRSSSSSGLANKENGSGSTTPSKERTNSARGGKKGGKNNGSGHSTPRSRSPGRSQRGSDPNRTSGIIGGITKVTENGWVYTGTGPTPRTSSPASNKLPGVDSRVATPGIATLSAGMMSIKLNAPGAYNIVSSYPNSSGMSSPWATGALGGGAPSMGQHLHAGYIQGCSSQQYIPPQKFTNSQFPQYFGPPNAKNQPFQQQVQSFPPYQASSSPGPHNLRPQQPPPLQSQPLPGYLGFQRPPPPNSSGPLLPQLPLPSAPRHDQTTGPPRIVYFQDPNAFAPRPPPLQGSIIPGFGHHPTPGDGNGDAINPIRVPRGPDASMGKGFSSRISRGVGAPTSVGGEGGDAGGGGGGGGGRGDGVSGGGGFGSS